MIDSRSVNKVKKKIVVDAMHAIMFVRSLQSIWLLIKKVFYIRMYLWKNVLIVECV